MSDIKLFIRKPDTFIRKTFKENSIDHYFASNDITLVMSFKVSTFSKKLHKSFIRWKGLCNLLDYLLWELVLIPNTKKQKKNKQWH